MHTKGVKKNIGKGCSPPPPPILLHINCHKFQQSETWQYISPVFHPVIQIKLRVVERKGSRGDLINVGMF